MPSLSNQSILESRTNYTCLIVDDEPPARDVLRRYVTQVPMLSLIGECTNAIQALSALKQQPIDLLFLDIQLPQLTGIELIRTLTQPPKIVLTTAYEHYAVQAFELDVTDYLIKPIRFERFLKSVSKALPDHKLPPISQPLTAPQPETAMDTFLYFRAERKMVKVFLGDLLYVESLKDYVKLHTTKGSIITKYAITALEAMLPGPSFLRVHRSYLVSLDKIDSFTSDQIAIGRHLIPIGKLYRQQALKLLNYT
ncbi:response regulator transcription factor [Spirosoma sp. BT702]|uniref:Response regulator transcription factor n=1 Tax=Spirosoma profusum TaxID=2771354 RepID=A0A927AWP6_9BACT|nr:response regulator transcription factor [Spirosoma profusum]MBD2705838.1 response regulator transcription factor [Spirosoma profusum]